MKMARSIVKANFKDGKRNGKFTVWLEDGQIDNEATFKDAQQVSSSVWSYNDKNQPYLKKNFKDGHPDVYTEYLHNDNGMIEIHSSYKDGECISSGGGCLPSLEL